MAKNPAAVALGKRSWKKRKSPAEITRLKEIAKLGAAKTNAIRSARRIEREEIKRIKKAARTAVFVEMRAGRLKRAECFCGETKTEAHHKDYTKPLDVEWLCKKHHAQADAIDKVAIPKLASASL